METMKIKIGAKTSYQESIIWQIQNNYYQQKGKETWKSGDVPFNISCNSRAAYQNARVVFESIDININNRNKKIYVIELGAGSGIFSLNFINEFKKICQSKNDAPAGKKLFKNLHYMITDYSEKNLLDISQNKLLQKLQKQGIVDFYLLDVTELQKVKKLNGSLFQLNEGMVTAVISNYLHSNLPVAILKKEKNNYFEKQMEIYLDLDVKTNDPDDFAKKFIANPAEYQILDKLEKKVEYKKIDINKYFKNEIERKTILETAKDFKNAWITYPFSSFSSIRKILPFIKKDGMLIISDKSYSDEANYLQKENQEVIHNNSISHTVNIPLFERFAINYGIWAIRTKSSDYSFHTIMLVNSKKIKPKVKKTFEEMFIKENINNYIFRDYHQAKNYLQKNELKNAALSYIKVLKYMPNESWLLYNIGICYFSDKNFAEALKYFEKGKENDSFNFFDFYLLIGLCLMNLQRYREAIKNFRKSIKSYGNNPKINYSIALCNKLLVSND